jgi:hypothetical protein
MPAIHANCAVVGGRRRVVGHLEYSERSHIVLNQI